MANRLENHLIFFFVLVTTAELFAQPSITAVERLADFEATVASRNLAKKTADALKELLDDVDYDAAMKQLFGADEYRESSCNTNRFEELDRNSFVREIERRPLTLRRKLALKLLFS